MANITQLLAALANLPPATSAPRIGPFTTPTPNIEPPDFIRFPPPEPPPPAPGAPLSRHIIDQYLAQLPPAPTPPPAPASIGRLDRLALALQAFGAGMQGQGPQFLASVRAERERPQREFEARREQYEERRSAVGLAGLEAAQRAADREQARQQAAADRRFDLEVQERGRQLGLRDQAEMEMLRDTLLTKRQREEREADERRQQATFRNQQMRDARTFASAYRKAGATDGIARELGEYDAGLRDGLSPTAAKWESAAVQLNEIRQQRERRLAAGAGRSGAGGSANTNAAAQKALAQFESVKQQVSDAVARGDAAGEAQLRRRLASAFNNLTRFPGVFELGYDQSGQWPYAKIRGQSAAQPPPQAGPRRAEAKAKLMANGFSEADAEAELNRLGIK